MTQSFYPHLLVCACDISYVEVNDLTIMLTSICSSPYMSSTTTRWLQGLLCHWHGCIMLGGGTLAGGQCPEWTALYCVWLASLLPGSSCVIRLCQGWLTCTVISTVSGAVKNRKHNLLCCLILLPRWWSSNSSDGRISAYHIYVCIYIWSIKTYASVKAWKFTYYLALFYSSYTRIMHHDLLLSK